MFQSFRKEIMIASVARWEEHMRMLIVLERRCLKLDVAVGQMSERQELLAALMESKKSLQKEAPKEFHGHIFQEVKALEEQKPKQSLELLEQKHRLERLKKKKGACQVSRERTARGGRCSYCYHWWFFSFLVSLGGTRHN